MHIKNSIYIVWFVKAIDAASIERSNDTTITNYLP